MPANCNPKQRPKKGILLFLAYSIALILPSIPRLPNPPGTIIPLEFANILSRFTSSSNDSESTQ